MVLIKGQQLFKVQRLLEEIRYLIGIKSWSSYLSLDSFKTSILI